MFDPLLHPPGDGAFRATAAVAESAPSLPRDVSRALAIAAAATALLLLLARGHTEWRRCAWVAAPSVIVLLWIVVAAPLPGAVRTTTLRLVGPDDDLVLLRFESQTATEIAFALPQNATSAAMLAFDDGDQTPHDAELGRSVHFLLPASGARVVAWREPPSAVAEREPFVTLPPPAAVSWARGLALDLVGTAADPGVQLTEARGFRSLPGACWRAAARK